jgi:TRAP-type C4-dicarboxylate transport system permease small subunit
MSAFRGKAAHWENCLDRVEKWVMIVLIALLTAVTFLQVFSRYALRDPIFWTEELARFLFIYVCMIGIAMGIGAKGHYGFENLFKIFPRGLQWFVALGIYLVIGFFIVVLTWKGLEELPSTANQVSVSLPVTMVWSYAALPLGGFLMMVHHLLRFIVDGPSGWHHRG